MIQLNYSVPTQAYDINNNSLFNTGCITEIQKIESMCATFKVKIIENISTRFKVALFLLIILIFYKLIVERYKPNYSLTNFYVNYLSLRIDFVIMILAIMTIALMFI